jgi:hypothetical protein
MSDTEARARAKGFRGLSGLIQHATSGDPNSNFANKDVQYLQGGGAPAPAVNPGINPQLSDETSARANEALMQRLMKQYPDMTRDQLDDLIGQ